MTATHRTEAVFTSTAATYDPARAKLIPCFAEFYAAAISLLPEHTNHVLDLGAGTGLLAAFVRERFANAHLHMIDNSSAMLDQARARFSRDQETAFTLADYTVCPWGEKYDAIVSALSIHHLPDDAKRKLFARILAALKPGGVFINAEQILQPTPELESRARQDWLAEVRALGATEEQIAASLLRQTEDRCATIADQLRWLAAAGFTHPRCTFEQGRFAVLTAAR
jgi:tRNA (cmo5U34)-methyltransferase